MYDTRGPRTEGSKYSQTKDLPLKEIAKLCRADIKAAIARGDLPQGIKVSVRCQFYSGGCSLNLTITAWPGSVFRQSIMLMRELLPQSDVWNTWMDREHPHTPELRNALGLLEEIAQAYNFDESNSMVDYFHNRFYRHVGIGWQLESAARASELEQLQHMILAWREMEVVQPGSTRRRLDEWIWKETHPEGVQ